MTEAVSQCFSRTQYNGYHRLEHRAKKQPLPFMGGGCFFCPTGFEGRTVQSNLPVDGCDRERPRRGYAEPRPNPVGWAYPRLNLSHKRCRFRYPVRRHHERSGQCSRNDSLYAAVLTKSKRKYNMINNLWTKTISYFRLNIE